MTIRALALWSSQWVPVCLRRNSLWWHDGPVGHGASIELEHDAGELPAAEAMRGRLAESGYRNVRLRERQEVAK